MSDKKLWEQYVALEKERDTLRSDLAEFQYAAAVANDTIKALQAKIEAMERQEPVMWANSSNINSSRINKERGGRGDQHTCSETQTTYHDAQLYALPGAQPAPSVPDATWLPVPDKHPTFDPVDLQLADGSVLCGCVPQSDGDYWWEGPSGEVFIDPRYAPVTHWRLSAAPEARQ